VAFSFEALCKLHQDFESKRIEKAKKIVGDRPMAPDPLVKFVVQRTLLCPHKLMTPLTAYWLETVTILDGEMGLTLPAPISETPALFFEAIGLVREGRAEAARDDKRE
jgi:hypothetical protein